MHTILVRSTSTTSDTAINVLPLGISNRPVPEVDTTVWAIFVQATYDLTEQLTMTVGGRYTEEEKDFAKNQGVYLLSDPLHFFCPCVIQ